MEDELQSTWFTSMVGTGGIMSCFSFLLNPVILIVVFTVKSYSFTIDYPVKTLGYSYQDLQVCVDFIFIIRKCVCFWVAGIVGLQKIMS